MGAATVLDTAAKIPPIRKSIAKLVREASFFAIFVCFQSETVQMQEAVKLKTRL